MCAQPSSVDDELEDRVEDRLGERRIRLDRVEQDVDRNLGAYGERQLSEPLAGLRPDRDGADENAPRTSPPRA